MMECADMPGTRNSGIDRREAVQRYQYRRPAFAQTAVDDLSDAAMIRLENRVAPRVGGCARQALLPGTAVASLRTGIELATQGGRLQSITSRE